MVTLRETLCQRGYKYHSIFAHVAEDVYFNTTKDLCFALGYILKNVHRVDAEIPNDRGALLSKILPNYPITTGYTSGGNEMKRAPQYRIYFNTTHNMPQELYNRLQNDNQMRITGSLFVEACMYIGFNPGNMQEKEVISAAIMEIFCNNDEQEAFRNGYGG